MAPHAGATLDPKALEINKITVDQIKTFPEPAVVLRKFIDWVDSQETLFALMGHNVQFDRKFLFTTMNMNQYNMEYITRFRTNDFCTLEMARIVFKGKRNKPEKFNLETLCKFFEIPYENGHDALSDIKMTYEVFLRLKAMMPASVTAAEKKPLTYQEKRRKYIDSRYIQFNDDGSFYGQSTISQDPDAARFIAEELFHLFGS